MPEESVTIEVSSELMGRVKSKLTKGENASLDVLISALLEEWVGTDSPEPEQGTPARIGPAEEQVIQERLKALGYV